ncbi:MobP2 family relaxase [Clostridium perfringens]|nr:MobP2 family relaxase [Clostridium perfringens]
MGSPGIVYKLRFITPQEGYNFESYINYIDRDKATKKYHDNDYASFNDYMGNAKKKGSLFTRDKDELNEKEIESLKNAFTVAQNRGSNLWQDVFSFNNDWLEEQGIYNSKTKVLDEERIHKAIRATMNTLETKCGYKDLVWSASLHYNTKHIHVHVATVQLNPDERGKREYKVLRAMKSSFANSLSDFSKEYKEINNIIRERFVDNRKSYDFTKDKMMKENVKQIIKLLPKDKRQWSYNYNSLQEVKPYLDEITRSFIDDNFKEDYKLLIKKLDEQEIKLKNMYGEKNTSLYKYYKDNKVDDLYTRMGNVTLKQIKDYVYENENKKFINSNREPVVTNRALSKIKKALRKDFDSIKNINEYEKLQNEIENSKQMDM